MQTQAVFFFALLTAIAHAGPRTSGSYSMTTESTDSGGKRATSATYTNDGSLGGIAGVSTVVAPAETVKAGFVGQLYEVTALQLAATPTTVNEIATRQLSGAQLLDDFTTNAVPAASITWSIVSGPLTSISTGGIVTAGTVYQDTAASAQGVYAGNTGTLSLSVIDSIKDNFTSYASDGIGDDWQVQYFGINSANAAPTLDLDQDGLNNFAEFALNLNPGTSSTLPAAGVRNGANFEYTYTRSVAAVNSGVKFAVEWSDTLATNDWQVTSVTQTVLSDNGTTQQVKAIIPAAGNLKFARLLLMP